MKTDAETATKDDRERYKDTRKAYYKFVRQAKYCEAIDLVINVFKLDERVKGLAGVYLSDEPGEMMETNTAEGADHIDVRKGLFTSNTTFGTFTRMLYHEFVHVYQVQVLGYRDYDKYHMYREFLAYTETVSNTSLPPADYDNQRFWESEIPRRWKLLTSDLQADYLMKLSFSLIYR